MSCSKGNSALGLVVQHNNVRFRDARLGKLMKHWKVQSPEKEKCKMRGKNNFGKLLKRKDPETGEGYSVGDLACESVVLMVADSQSTSGGLALLLYLAYHPVKLSKLRGEICDAFASEDAIRYELGGKLASLPYLRACVNESLRFSPPTPGHLPRKIVEAQGLVVDCHWFPPGTNVGVAPYAIHRNESYFDEPMNFYLERWVDKEMGDGLVSAFAPFSAGNTGCIGRLLAMMELCLAVARLLWRFDLQAQATGEDQPIEYRMRGCFAGEKVEPKVQLIRCSS